MGEIEVATPFSMSKSVSVNLWVLNALLLLIGVLGAAGDVWVYRWSRSTGAFWLVAAMIAHVCSVGCFAILMRTDTRSFSVLFMLSSVVHVIVVVVSDVVFWGARLNRTEWLGLLLAMLACLLLEQRPSGEESKGSPLDTVETHKDEAQ